jgi:hypothetical protein
MRWVATILTLILCSCSFSLLKMPAVKPDSTTHKTDTLRQVIVDSSGVKRYETIIHSIDTVVKKIEVPNFSDKDSLIQWQAQRIEAQDGQILSLTNALREMKPEPCFNTRETIHEGNDLISAIAGAISTLIIVLGGKFLNKKKDVPH